tara:strand:- start:3147 stop:4478 length:1332 start_codon:yes stop_codon:yes gene_type:complete
VNKNSILIIGSGISGLGAARLAAKHNFNTILSTLNKINEKQKIDLINQGVKIEEGSHSNLWLDSVDFIVKSPGVSPKIPILLKARKKSLPIISEIEFASSFNSSKIIAITGTNGKTTTSTLLFYILKNAGLNVDLAGNIGKSFSESILTNTYDYHVLELSSFQLEDIDQFRPQISIILNISKDHMNRYDSYEEYVNAKLKINMNQNEENIFIYPYKVKSVEEYHTKAKKYTFGKNKSDNSACGAWIENDEIIIKTIKNNFTMTIHNLALKGTHNIYNSMAAALAASALGIKNEIIRKSLADFQGINHRMELVGKISGVNFINDSKATNCNAVYYALETVSSPIVWICGGVDKGNDYSNLIDLVENKVKSIVVLGNDTKKIKNNFGHLVQELICVNSMKEAVKTAYSISNVGDTVLFSPACASFDLFKNYEERGEAYKSCVLEI